MGAGDEAAGLQPSAAGGQEEACGSVGFRDPQRHRAGCSPSVRGFWQCLAFLSLENGPISHRVRVYSPSPALTLSPTLTLSASF